jgi:hypothetical protein
VTGQPFHAWAIVELFGHQRCAGRLSEQTIGSETFIRVDIPRRAGGEYTRLFGKGAIYCINICEESAARNYATQAHEPLQPYTALPAPADSPDPDSPAGLSFREVPLRETRDRDDYDHDDDFPY